MNKCPKCSTEYEGNVCPSCGDKWQGEKMCPHCKATLYGGARVCPHCGYSFELKPTEKALSWVKSHKFVIFTVIMLIIFSVLLPIGIVNRYDGKYVRQNNQDSSIVIKGKSWSYGETTGTYKIKNGEIDFYIEIFGEKMLYNSASFNFRTITFSEKEVYKKAPFSGSDIYFIISIPIGVFLVVVTLRKVIKLAKIKVNGASPSKSKNKRQSIALQEYRYQVDLGCFVFPPNVTEIEEFAFEECIELKNIIIPNSVTTIQAFAFNGCENLDSIVIGHNVKLVRVCAFQGCNALTHVYYNGTAEGWNKVAIEGYNTALASATIYYYSATVPTEEGNFWHYVNGKPTAW